MSQPKIVDKRSSLFEGNFVAGYTEIGMLLLWRDCVASKRSRHTHIYTHHMKSKLSTNTSAKSAVGDVLSRKTERKTADNAVVDKI